MPPFAYLDPYHFLGQSYAVSKHHWSPFQKLRQNANCCIFELGPSSKVIPNVCPLMLKVLVFFFFFFDRKGVSISYIVFQHLFQKRTKKLRIWQYQHFIQSPNPTHWSKKSCESYFKSRITSWRKPKRPTALNLVAIGEQKIWEIPVSRNAVKTKQINSKPLKNITSHQCI